MKVGLPPSADYPGSVVCTVFFSVCTSHLFIYTYRDIPQQQQLCSYVGLARHASIVPLASGLAVPEPWHRARSFPPLAPLSRPHPDPIPSLSRQVGGPLLDCSRVDLLDVVGRQVGRAHLGKLQRVRARPVLRREVLHDDSGKLGAQTQHLGPEALAHASVEAVRVDLATPWHRKCRHTRLDRHGWQRAAWNRRGLE